MAAPKSEKRFKRKTNRRGRGRRGKARIGINPSYHAPKNFCETIIFKTVTSAPSSGGGGGSTTDLALNPQNLSLLNTYLKQFYRQYCIRGIKISYKPAYNNYPLQAGVAIAPRVYFAEDKTALVTDNDAINISKLLLQDNVKEFNAYRPWSRYIKFPKPYLTQNTMYTSGTSQQVAVQTPANKPIWLSLQKMSTVDEEQTGLEVPHLVGRLVTDDNNSAVTITLGTLYYKVYYSVKEQALFDDATSSN